MDNNTMTSCFVGSTEIEHIEREVKRENKESFPRKLLMSIHMVQLLRRM